jgi:hypothetical protein
MSPGLLALDLLAAVLILVGFHLAFRQDAVRGLAARAGLAAAARELDAETRAGFDSVLRMAGVMIMAFSFTIAAFGHLIVYYTAHSPN